MRILGIDTSTKLLSLGVSYNTKIYEYNIELATLVSRLLAPTIKRVIEAINCKVSDIDYFACGLGPGSFTGIRVGMACIKGLSWSLKKPVIGIPTLDIMAAGITEHKGYIVPCVDAKRGLVYCAIYRRKGLNTKRLTSYLLLKPQELIKKISPGTLIMGDAIGLYKEAINKAGKDVFFADKDYWYPKGHCIIELAKEKLKAGKINNAFNIKPIYLYPKECQIRNSNVKIQNPK